LKEPILPIFIGDASHLRSHRRAADGFFTGPDRPALNPLGEDRNFFIAQLALGRHLQIFIFITDRFNEQTLALITRHNRRATGTTQQKRCP